LEKKKDRRQSYNPGIDKQLSLVTRLQKKKTKDDKLINSMTALCPRQPDECSCKNSPIMVVDDTVFNLETLKVMIREQYGVEVVTAQDGEQAFNLFKEINQPDSTLPDAKKVNRKPCQVKDCNKQLIHLIFMDLQMPVLDGFDSTVKILEYQKSEKIKPLIQNKKLPDCKIIALTSFVN